MLPYHRLYTRYSNLSAFPHFSHSFLRLFVLVVSVPMSVKLVACADRHRVFSSVLAWIGVKTASRVGIPWMGTLWWRFRHKYRLYSVYKRQVSWCRGLYLGEVPCRTLDRSHECGQRSIR